MPWRLAGFVILEEAFLVVALPGSWVFLLFFARLKKFSFGHFLNSSRSHIYYFRGALLTGPFVQMIYSMIAGDILRFLIVACIFLVSFAQGRTHFTNHFVLYMIL